MGLKEVETWLSPQEIEWVEIKNVLETGVPEWKKEKLARWNLVGPRVELQANYYALLVVGVYWKEPAELDVTGTVDFAANLARRGMHWELSMEM